MKKVTAKITQLLLCPTDRGDNPEDVTSQIVSALALTSNGITGDRHAGFTMVAGGRQKEYIRPGETLPNLRQVSIVTVEELSQIAHDLGIPEVTGADLGANIVLQGVPNLSSFPAGVNGVIKISRYALLYCMGENEPCSGPGKAIAARLQKPELVTSFAKVALHRRGIVAMVASAGVIRTSDTVELFFPAWTGWNPGK